MSSFGYRYFSRPPLRSHHFWVNTLFLVLVASQAIYCALHAGSRRDVEAITTVVFPIVVLVLLWFKVLQLHRRLYKSHGDYLVAPREGSPTVGILLDNLAYLSYAGFGLALFATGSAYIAIVLVGYNR
jgi:hypothetical protein